MNKKQKKMLIRIIVASVLLIGLTLVTHLIEINSILKFLLYLVPYLIVGYDILRKAIKGILNKQVFDENFLMAIATVGAIAVAIYENSDYTDAIAVMLLYQIGELFQSYAVGKSRKNISELMDIRPDFANIEVDGQLEQVDPDEVAAGSIIVVQPGEKIPIDGVVISGSASLNTSALTGESVPRDVTAGDDTSMAVGDMIEDTVHVPPDEFIRRNEIYADLMRLTSDLSDMERNILFVQYGIPAAGMKNENDIRTVYGLDAGKIVRIAEEALEKVRGSADVC